MEETKTKNSKSWCETMMSGSTKYFTWFPVMGILFMGSILLLGYCLNAEAVRVLWLIFAGIGILMIIFGWIMMRAMMKGFGRGGMTGFRCPCFGFADAFEKSQESEDRKWNCCC